MVKEGYNLWFKCWEDEPSSGHKVLISIKSLLKYANIMQGIFIKTENDA